MSDFAFVAAVTGVFFLIGAAFGALAIVAVSALRTDAERAARRRARRDDEGDGPPRWPGGFGGR